MKNFYFKASNTSRDVEKFLIPVVEIKNIGDSLFGAICGNAYPQFIMTTPEISCVVSKSEHHSNIQNNVAGQCYFGGQEIWLAPEQELSSPTGLWFKACGPGYYRLHGENGQECLLAMEFFNVIIPSRNSKTGTFHQGEEIMKKGDRYVIPAKEFNFSPCWDDGNWSNSMHPLEMEKWPTKLLNLTKSDQK